MVYQEETFIGKNGAAYTLRSPRFEDAGQMLDYLKTTAAETEYGLSYPEEMDFTVQDEEAMIASFSESENAMMISAFQDGVLVGNALLSAVFEKKKARHRADCSIALLKQVWGQGLGRKMLSELLVFAKQAGYAQVELEVSSTNLSAVNLYQSLGFKIYGERPRSLRLKDGSYVRELLMVLELV